MLFLHISSVALHLFFHVIAYSLLTLRLMHFPRSSSINSLSSFHDVYIYAVYTEYTETLQHIYEAFFLSERWTIQIFLVCLGFGDSLSWDLWVSPADPDRHSVVHYYTVVYIVKLWLRTGHCCGLDLIIRMKLSHYHHHRCHHHQ